MIINKKELKEKEAILYKIVSKKAILPILKTYLFNNNAITATDLEHTLTFRLNTVLPEDTSCCIEATRLHKFLSKIDGENIEIVVDEKFITIEESEGGVKIRFNNEFPVKDYPMTPKPENPEYVTIDLKDMKELMLYCYKAVSKDESRPVLQGIQWDIRKRTIKAQATDSYRVHIKKCPMFNKFFKNVNFLVEGRKMYELFKNLKGHNVNIHNGKSIINFWNDDFSFTTRLMENEFPNTQALMDGCNFNYVYKINVEKFTKTLKKLIPFENWNNKDYTPHLKFKKSIATFYLKNREEVISKNIFIDTLKSDGDFEIGIDFRYLLEAIENLKDEFVYLKCVSELKPIWVVPEQTDFKALIMPIRLL